MPTPLTDADKVLRNDTGKDIVEKLDDIAQALGVGVNADQINYDNTESGLEADDVQEAIDELNDNKADKTDLDITSEITTPASVQTFNDGGDNIPLKSCEVAIVAQQAGAGTPSPDNIRAITGFDAVDVEVCGKNFNQITETSGSHNGITYTFNDDGTISTSGSVPSGNSYKSVGHFILQAGTYTISGLPSSLVAEARKCAMVLCKDAYSGSVNVIKTIYSNAALSDQFTLTEATDCYLRIYIYPAAGNISDVIFSPQIELSNEATAYETHKGVNHTIPLGQTVYGGSLECVEGEGQITHGYLELDGSSDEQFNWVPSGSTVYINLQVSDLKGGTLDGACNWLQVHNDSTQFGVRLGASSTSKYILFDRITENISDVTDLASWRTYLSSHPIQIVYPLATPTSLSVSGANIPTLSGLNNIYTDCGDIQSLEYYNNKTDELVNLIRLMTRS